MVEVEDEDDEVELEWVAVAYQTDENDVHDNEIIDEKVHYENHHIDELDEDEELEVRDVILYAQVYDETDD